jgi:hypothetical protein
MNPRTPIRHGEVLLLPVPAAPEGRTETVARCVVGHSESGHHHVLESDAAFRQIVTANGDLFVDLDAPTPLRHHKANLQHRELIVPSGAWRIIRKTEFDVRSMPMAPPDPPIRPQRSPLPATPAIAPPPRWVRPVRD